MSENDEEHVIIKKLQTEIRILQERVKTSGIMLQYLLDAIPDETIKKEKDLICQTLIMIRRSTRFD